MTQKALSIVVKVSDQATAGLRRITRDLAGLGRRAATEAAGVARVAKAVVGSIASIQTAFVGLVAFFAARSVFRGFRDTITEIDQLADDARRVGMAFEDLSTLRYAATLTGADVRALVAAVRSGMVNLTDFARRGVGPVGDALKMLRLDIRSLTGPDGQLLSLDRLLPRIADSLSRVRSQADRISISQAIFGRGGFTVLELLQNGSVELRRMMGEAEKLGAVVTPAIAEAAGRLDDSFARVRYATFGLRAQFLEVIVDPVEAFLDRVAYRIAEVPQLVRASAYAVTQALNVGTPDSEQARGLLAGLRDGVGGLLVTSAVEIGRTIGVAFVEAVALGLEAITPTIERVFRNALGPILSAIPGIDITPTVDVQLDKLRRVRDELRINAEALQRVEYELEHNPRLDGSDRSGLTSRASGIRARIQQILAEFAGGEVELEQRIRDMERRVAQRSRVQADQIATAFASAFQATSQTAGQAVERIGARLETLDAARQSLVDFYAAAVPQADDTARAGADLGFFLETVGSIWDRMKARASAAAEGIRKTAATVTEHIGATTERLRLYHAELNVRRLQATGQDQAAQRAALALKHEKERLQLVKEYGQELARVVLPALEEIQRLEMSRLGTGPKPQAPMSFAEGWKAGIEDLKGSLADLGQFGQQLSVQLFTSISSGLASAIIDVVSGVRSAKDAMREFLASTLSMVAQLILQFLILKMLVAAIPGFGSFFGIGGAYQGGVARGGRIERFAAGGVVPGRNVNKDTVPALLAGGEGVANRMAMRRNPGLIQYINAGGVAGQSGGPLVHMDVTIEGNTDQGQLTKLERSVEQAVLRALQTRPGYRSQMRGLLA